MNKITHGIPINLYQVWILFFLLLVASYQVYGQSDQYKEAYAAYQTQNFEKASSIWTRLAEDGDFNAQYALGVMELRGETETADPKQAFEWFQLAADQGHTTAMFNLGVAYWEGAGVKRDRERALKWWERSANSGESGAQYNLGLAYYIGEEIPADLQRATKWIGMAAEQNHPEAKRMYLALTHENLQHGSPEVDSAVDEQTTFVDDTDDTHDTDKGEADIEGESDTATEQVMVASVDQQPPPKNIQYWRTHTSTALSISPSSSAVIFANLPEGAPVEIIKSENDWSKVTLPDGLKTWVFGEFITVNGDQGVIKGTGVRIRPSPSTDNHSSPPIGSYNNGDQVTVLEQSGEWVRIRAPKQVGGWVPNKNLESYLDSEQSRSKLWNDMVSSGL